MDLPTLAPRFRADPIHVDVLHGGWVNYGRGHETFHYFVDESGVVHIGGLVKSGAQGNENYIFQLPIGLRPSKCRIFATQAHTTSGKFKNCNVYVSADGNVWIYNCHRQYAWVSLDGIHFLPPNPVSTPVVEVAIPRPTYHVSPVPVVQVSDSDIFGGWRNYGSGHATVHFFKDHSGLVHVGGLIKEGTVGKTQAFISLPEGFRPARCRIFGCQGHRGGKFKQCNVYVDAQGKLWVYDDGNTYSWLSLDGIVFNPSA